MERKLAVILVADMVGYAARMERDETGTLETLSAHMTEFVIPLVERNRGKVIKLLGDGLLAQFESASDAVSCALDWQKASPDGSDPLCFRIGINLGDIILRDGDVFGSGVNLASRLEQLAPPGGVLVSDAVYRAAGNRLTISWEDAGTFNVKNVAEPVHAWRFGGSDRYHNQRPHSEAKLKPTIAVLPFHNMSNDPEQIFFSDGIAEDIITGLSRFRTLQLVSRNASFRFRSQEANPAETAEALGADYLVQGSVRKAGSRVRISVQLSDANSGSQLWSDRYDHELEDVLEVQDDVTRSIVAVLPGRVQHDVADRSTRKPENEMKAYELMLKGKALRDGLNARDTAKARALLERAVALDPSIARSFMYLSDTYVIDLWLGLADSDAADHALHIARKGAALDNQDVYIQDQLGFAYLCAGLWTEAETQFEKTLSLIETEAESMAWCGYAFLLLGRHEKARDVVSEAMQMDPLHPPAIDWIMGQIQFFCEDFEAALGLLMGEARLNSLATAFVAASFAKLGRQVEAEAALLDFTTERRDELMSRDIQVNEETVSALARGFQTMWRRPDDFGRLAAGLHAAGLPS
ncbi:MULTISPECIES: adenylate/guanylate cyclase domain-containing protein [unclassified Ruegeria]|uniref:adenylate/guanylate cyclase domain-containing protein n=1 Tax=unclassified Ruegeria TaxID=2625375 RepID=UPI0014926252|nr:adenylate/guanylate cyclase domain-containing protein [Ruegeria sp. HKCCD5849]NOD51537.1 adenylate/guanylate cyclase domain-containing protein [Ruegeria sp. HKCCD5851]NOD69318.1 adenylate/guanylate cyclase domain-containing protein [Ruegeria sp. HKCCD7303]